VAVWALPLRVDVIGLGPRRLAAAVWELIPVAEMHRKGSYAATGVRQQFAVARSAGILVKFYPRLRSLREWAYMT
jgi:hypothetical protein